MPPRLAALLADAAMTAKPQATNVATAGSGTGTRTRSAKVPAPNIAAGLAFHVVPSRRTTARANPAVVDAAGMLSRQDPRKTMEPSGSSRSESPPNQRAFRSLSQLDPFRSVWTPVCGLISKMPLAVLNLVGNGA